MLHRVFGSPNRGQREWLLLVSACMVRVAAGQTTSGPVYANYMRSIFGLKQTELDIAMTLQCSGTLLMFISGLVNDHWGPRVAIAVGGIASTIVSLAVTLVFAFPEPLHGRPWILWLLFFVYGHSYNYCELATLAAGAKCFSADRSGRVMAIMDNAHSLGPLVSALVHYIVFGNIYRSPDEQNAVGLMAIQTGLTAITHAIAFVFIYQPELYDANVVQLGELTPILKKADRESAKGEEDEPNLEEDRAMLKETQPESACEFVRATLLTFCTGPFLLLLGAFSLGLGQYLAVWFNVTTVTRSLGLSSMDMAYFWVPIGLSLLWPFCLGAVSDKFCTSAWSRAAALLACVATFGSLGVLLITVPMLHGVSPLGVTLSSYTMTVLSISSIFTLGPVIMAQTNPQRMFGRLHAACMFGGTAVSLMLAFESGKLYDERATILNGTVTCSGHSCYERGNIAPSACHFASVILLMGLVTLLWVRGA